MDTKVDLFEDVPAHLVEGDMSIPGIQRNKMSQSSAYQFNTLQEPIKETILRDIMAVGNKFYHIIYPKQKSNLLRDWDLWGPLVLCTLMATFLQSSNRTDGDSDDGPEFAQVFVMVWIGAIIVTVNSKLLGGNISFFQSVCVIGYCLLPVVVALIICRVVLLAKQTQLLFYLRLVTSAFGFAWATYAAFIFLGDSQQPNRKALAVYPILMFFFIMSWLVISHS